MIYTRPDVNTHVRKKGIGLRNEPTVRRISSNTLMTSLQIEFKVTGSDGNAVEYSPVLRYDTVQQQFLKSQSLFQDSLVKYRSIIPELDLQHQCR